VKRRTKMRRYRRETVVPWAQLQRLDLMMSMLISRMRIPQKMQIMRPIEVTWLG
jgi:hypothetical protein